MQQRRGLGFLSLVATTYFLVSGGPYGLEELIGKAGWRGAIVALLAAPILWSLPTALLVGELAAALPEEGGYYAWVRRALGPFWGFQEAWISLAASVFDMGIYPTLFALYLGRAFPALGVGPWPVALGALMIVASVAWNLRGARAVGGSSMVMTVLLLGPFVVLTAIAAATPAAATAGPPVSAALVPGLLVAMWNNMGWDNASTIAGEVDDPQRTYPRAMIAAVVLVAVSYVVPLVALSHAGIDAASLGTTGAWVDVGATLGGRPLAMAITLGGALSGLGMFNALLLSYSRVPMALARDGLFPAWLARESPKTGVPTGSIVACAVCWSATLGLGFERLVELDVILYGIALLLEFVALIVLRVREPGLLRPFRVPGGLVGAVLLALGPTVLLGLALVDLLRGGKTHGLMLAGVVIAMGPAAYAIGRRRAQKHALVSAEHEDSSAAGAPRCAVPRRDGR